ncbi:MAG TPA: hypothetical protein VHC43_07655 [Mycobacteriales bacterium]|nr:hypothetical protein [Mycobacteriales bacterium]
MATIDDPHYSTGAPGVIVKIRTTCVGDVPTTLQVYGYLYQRPPGFIGPPQLAATNSKSYNFVGGTMTWTMYVPNGSVPGLPCHPKYKYSASMTGAINGVQQFAVGPTVEKTVTCP